MTIETYLRALEKGFSPELACGKHVILQYQFTGSLVGVCHAVIEDCTIRTALGPHPAPTAAVTVDFDLWMRLLSYQEDPLIAYQDGRYSIIGDVEMLLESDTWFPRQLP